MCPAGTSGSDRAAQGEAAARMPSTDVKSTTVACSAAGGKEAVARPTEAAAAGKAANEDAFSDFMQKVEALDVSTGPNQAVFYSGKGSRQAAEAFARLQDKKIIEMTPGGKWLDDKRLFSNDSPLSPEQAQKVWARLSERFAQEASGNVTAFIHDVRPGSIFNSVEYPALVKNPLVTDIISGGL